MTQEQELELARRCEQVVTRAWADEAFKQRLLTEPRAVLEKHGIPLREGVALRVMENTAEVVHLVLPACPSTDVSGYGGEMPGQPGVSGPVPATSSPEYSAIARLITAGSYLEGLGFAIAETYKPKPR
jgi:hypothetical protein